MHVIRIKMTVSRRHNTFLTKIRKLPRAMAVIMTSRNIASVASVTVIVLGNAHSVSSKQYLHALF